MLFCKVKKNNMPRIIYKIFTIIILLNLIGCAKRGTLTGGQKDTLSPILKGSFPENFSTQFKGGDIKLVFDEYVKLKDLNKQLIISPPMKNQPEITPTNTSKYISIKIKDTLLPNTTYSFNFGQSIEDNNEGNPFSQFKYVISTGNYIDSLFTTVRIKDALEKKAPTYTSVMLYEINEKFNDSTIYKEVPNYISNSLEKLETVKIENVKAGKYLLIALKDNGNNKFNPATDKIGFRKDYITLPNDSVFEVKLFKETIPFQSKSATLTSKNRILVGYEGKADNINISLKNGNAIVPSVLTKFPQRDSLQVWFKPFETDSLQVSVEKNDYKKESWVKIRELKTDTLSFSANFPDNLPLRERFSITSSIPLAKFDQTKITVINKDSVAVSFDIDYDKMLQTLFFDFKKEPREKYTVSLLPGALIDFYEKPNDSLNYKLSTKGIADFGNLIVQLENVNRFPLITELIDAKGVVKATEYSEKNTKIDFSLLEPGTYSLRVIYDDNGNKAWDTGSYMDKKQPEEVIYLSKEITIRPNWDVEQPFDVRIKN